MEFVEAVAEILLKWTYNPDQSRAHGQFASGTGQNIVNPGRNAAAKPKPVNQAAIAAQAPALPAAATLPTSHVRLHGGGGGGGGAGGGGGGKKKTPAKKKPTPKKKTSTKPTKTAPATVAHGSEADTRSAPASVTAGDQTATLTVTHHASAKDRIDARETAAKEHTEMQAIRAALATGPATVASQKQRDAAVVAMRKKYGIPASLRGVSPERQHAAATMAAATRTLVTARAAATTASRRLAAAQAQQKTAQSPAAKAYVAAHIDQARKQLAAVNARIKTAQTEFNAGRKAWG